MAFCTSPDPPAILPLKPLGRTNGSPKLNPKTDVQGARKLIDIFGDWPSFHDAEVIEARLDRRGRDDFEGPTLWLRVHLFQGREDTNVASGVSWYNHTIATLRFANVHGLAMEGFNGQNAISDLRMERAGSHPLASGLSAISVSLDPSFGIGCSFVCSSVEVSAVESGIPPGSVYCD